MGTFGSLPSFVEPPEALSPLSGRPSLETPKVDESGLHYRPEYIHYRYFYCQGSWCDSGFLRHLAKVAPGRLAATHDAPRVASELGHTTPQLLYSCYRELVLPAEADTYWKIGPAAEPVNVVAFTGA